MSFQWKIILKLDKKELQRIISDVEKENEIFSNKSALDNLLFADNIIGRKDEAKALVRLFLGYRKGLVVPFVSVYGRSGCGKSTIVKFVCQNLDEVQHCFANLRKAMTVFGCANIILSELGEANLKNAQGLKLGVEKIGNTIEAKLARSEKKLFILVLDELDALFADKRGNPSDFIYNLVFVEETLREKGCQLCIVGISNNAVSEYDLDDRVRSRIGSSEVFFEAYGKDDVLAILKERAKQAFSKKIDPKVLEHCAELSSDEHGDARRAINLLRAGAEIAGRNSESISPSHIDMALEQLYSDRIQNILSTASHHLKVVAASLARITFLSGEVWHSTSTLYKQYQKILGDREKPLSYRRISELLVDLSNSGITVSQTSSKGRHGYGTQFKLTIPPEMVGKACFPEWWENLAMQKTEHEQKQQHMKFQKSIYFGKSRALSNLQKSIESREKRTWKDFTGFD